jgi:LPXTG-motif cell wall-anchored protein
VWTAAFEPLTITDGVLTVGSKSLYAPTTDTSGIGPRFLGAHYCTLVGPDYLARVIAENSAPIPTPTPTPTVTTSAPEPSATTTTTTGPGFLAGPSTTPPASESPDADTAGGALPETGAASGGTALLGALALAVGLLLVARARDGRWLPAGPGRHRAQH